MKIIKGQWIREQSFKKDDLIKALLKHKPCANQCGEKNHKYKNGNGEKYIRIRVNGIKVKKSHVVWMLWNNKRRIPIGKDIHHKDEDKRNDHITNLELVDHAFHGTNNLKYTKKVFKKPKRGSNKK